MQTLVGDLLTLAQLEGSPRPAADRWVAVDALLRAGRGRCAGAVGGRHALTFDERPAQIAGAAGRAAQRDHQPGQQRRALHAGGRPHRRRWRILRDGGGEIEVSDTGMGIAREHLPRLTERFYRVDGSRSRDTGGTGLGLSIVKHVVQRHGGELDIQSEPGKGSSFRLLFPRRGCGPRPMADAARDRSTRNRARLAAVSRSARCAPEDRGHFLVVGAAPLARDQSSSPAPPARAPRGFRPQQEVAAPTRCRRSSHRRGAAEVLERGDLRARQARRRDAGVARHVLRDPLTSGR